MAVETAATGYPVRGWTTETLERGFLHREVSFDTEVGGRRVLVAEPQGDDGDVDAGLKQVHVHRKRIYFDLLGVLTELGVLGASSQLVEA